MSETTVVEQKMYALRQLQAKDVFPMFRILSKIGVKEFKTAFESAEIQSVIKGGESDMEKVGIAVAFDIAGIIISNVGSCESEIFSFLSGLSGMGKEDIGNLGFAEFTQMIIDVVKKEEFKDFIKVVSALFK